MVESSGSEQASATVLAANTASAGATEATAQAPSTTASSNPTVSKRGRRGNLGLNQFSDWQVGEDYVCERLLGTGSYGKVALATRRSTGQKVAIKRMENIFEDETDCKRILREVTLMRKLKHPFVVELVELLYPKNPATFDTLYVVMEYAESDLKKIIKSNINLEMQHT